MDAAHTALRSLFGFEAFRPGQAEAVRGQRANHCDACFTGDYPLAGTEEHAGKFAFELPLARA